MAKLENNKTENRTRIMEAAFRVFVERGLENARVSDIVRESGLARGTFYNYFDSVDDIWNSLTSELQIHLSEIAHQARRNASSPHTFIADAYRIAFSIFHSRPEALQLLARNQTAARTAFLTGPGVDSILRLLETDMRESGFFNHLSQEQIAMASFAMVGAAFEMLVQFHERGIPLDPEKNADDLTRLFLYGMLGGA